MTQLENAKKKLERLKEEQDGLMKAIYYFVKDLKKVALVLNDSGDFRISKHYPAYSDSDIEFVEKLLKK